MAQTRSLMSAPAASQMVAISLMKLSFAARKAFEAYLIISAVVGVVTTTCVPEVPKSSATSIPTRRLSAPTTMRSGAKLSATAVPSRRNSGLETTETSERLIILVTRSTVPTGTVDLFTTTAPARRCGLISAAAASMNERSAEPSSPCGVGTHRNTKSHSTTAFAAEASNCSRPASRPSARSWSRPGSRIGTSPAMSFSRRFGSRSAKITSCPRRARTPALGSPT